jgi:hypothetical protein
MLALVLLGAGVHLGHVHIQARNAARRARAALLVGCQRIPNGATEQEVEEILGWPGEVWQRDTDGQFFVSPDGTEKRGAFQGMMVKSWYRGTTVVDVWFVRPYGAYDVTVRDENGFRVSGTPPIRIPGDGP